MLKLHTFLHPVIYCPGIILFEALNNTTVSVPDVGPFLFTDPTFQGRFLFQGAREGLFNRCVRNDAAALLRLS